MHTVTTVRRRLVLVAVKYQIQMFLSQDLEASPKQYARYQRATIREVQSIRMSLRSRHRQNYYIVAESNASSMELICGDCHHLQGVGQNYCGCDPAIVSSERQNVAVTAHSGRWQWIRP